MQQRNPTRFSLPLIHASKFVKPVTYCLDGKNKTLVGIPTDTTPSKYKQGSVRLILQPIQSRLGEFKP